MSECAISPPDLALIVMVAVVGVAVAAVKITRIIVTKGRNY